MTKRQLTAVEVLPGMTLGSQIHLWMMTIRISRMFEEDCNLPLLVGQSADRHST